MAHEPGKIRNVAVVGHRGTGKSSLVEAMLFQSGATNRLGTIEAGSTVSDWDEDEQRRKMSLAATICHLEWHDRKINLIDTPGDAGFVGDAMAAIRVVEGALFVVSGVMGVEVQTSRNWKRAADGNLSRVLFVNMLDRERADFFRVLGCAAGTALRALRRDPPADRCGARADRHRRPPAHVRVHEPGGPARGQGDRDSRRAAGAGRRVPHEAARRRRRDRREADGALPRRRRAPGRRGRARAEGRGHARRAVPGGLRRGDEEPRHDGAARPARRGRAVAGEEGLADRRRRRGNGRVRVQDDRRSVRRPDQRLPRSQRIAQGRLGSGERARAREGAHRTTPRDAGQGAQSDERARRGRHRRGAEAEGHADRRPAARRGTRRGAAEHRVSRARDELRRRAEGKGRRGEDGVGATPSRRGGSDDPPPARPADRRRASLGPLADPRGGGGRAAQAPVRRGGRAAPAARAVPRDDPQAGAGAGEVQEADGRPRPVRRLSDHRRAARGARGLRVRRQDRRRGHPAELPPGGRQGRPGSHAARRARRRAGAGRPRLARRRFVPQRRLVGDGVQDRRLDGVQAARTRTPTPCCSSRSWRSR